MVRIFRSPGCLFIPSLKNRLVVVIYESCGLPTVSCGFQAYRWRSPHGPGCSTRMQHARTRVSTKYFKLHCFFNNILTLSYAYCDQLLTENVVNLILSKFPSFRSIIRHKKVPPSCSKTKGQTKRRTF